MKFVDQYGARWMFTLTIINKPTNYVLEDGNIENKENSTSTENGWTTSSQNKSTCSVKYRNSGNDQHIWPIELYTTG